MRSSGTGTSGQSDTRRPQIPKGKTKPRGKTVAVRATGGEIRLNKFLADAGVAARRKADDLIASGAVKVNGLTVSQAGMRVDPSRDTVTVNGLAVTIDPKLVYIILNKPRDCITTVSDERGRRTVLDLVPVHHRLYPVGRLDRNTTGVLLLTNDGDLAHRLMHPRFHVRKVYQVHVDRKFQHKDLVHLRRGVRLSDGMTAPCEAEILDPPQNRIVGVILTEGRNRQVRRMFETLGYDIKKLERLEYAGLSGATLKRGGWRYLDEHEVKRLQKLSGHVR